MTARDLCEWKKKNVQWHCAHSILSLTQVIMRDVTLPCWHKSQRVSLSRLCSVTLSPLFLYSQQRKRTETIPRCSRIVFAIGFGCGPPSCQRSFHYLWRELQRVTCSAEVLLNPRRYPAQFCHPWLLLTFLWIRQHIQRFWPGQKKLLSCRQVARSSSAGIR